MGGGWQGLHGMTSLFTKDAYSLLNKVDIYLFIYRKLVRSPPPNALYLQVSSQTRSKAGSTFTWRS